MSGVAHPRGAATGPGAAPAPTVEAGGPDFDALYRFDPDPWEVGTSWYERRKIAVVLATLRREKYALAWDAGCGTGHLSLGLAGRCDAVLATDASPTAVALTAAATAGAPGVRAAASSLPQPPPLSPGQAPDLIVLSEVLYYLERDDREATYDLIDALADPAADVVGVHWRARAQDYALPGAHAQRELGDALAARGWSRQITHTDEEFLVGLWSRALPERLGR